MFDPAELKKAMAKHKVADFDDMLEWSDSQYEDNS